VLTSQRYRVTLQLLDAEQLRAQQLRIPIVMQRIPRARRNSEPFDDYDVLLALPRAPGAAPALWPVFVETFMHGTFGPQDSNLPIAMILR
jgi:hypothetical protein